MVKGKPWTPETLRKVGGTEGVGITFLEESFRSPQANPKHRLQLKAAQSVLKALLPEIASDIKGQMRSRKELLEASGLASRTKDFDDLIHTLDSELRLITPTDPHGTSSAENQTTLPGEQYYQLAHDYLVHSLRDWLTRRQRETRRGRAELLLSERAALWAAKPEARYLPTVLEWISISMYVPKNARSVAEQRSMRKAGVVSRIRLYLATPLIVLLTFIAAAFWQGLIRMRVAMILSTYISRCARQHTTRNRSMILDKNWLTEMTRSYQL